MQFVGVAWVGDDESFGSFIDRHGLTFPQLSDDPGDVFARFEVPYQPAVVVVTPSGEVQQFFGAIDGRALDEALTSVTT